MARGDRAGGCGLILPVLREGGDAWEGTGERICTPGIGWSLVLMGCHWLHPCSCMEQCCLHICPSFLTASLCPSCLPSVQDWSQAVHDGAVLCHLQTHPRVPVCTPGPVSARQVPPARGSGDGSLAKPSSLSALLDRWDLSWMCWRGNCP